MHLNNGLDIPPRNRDILETSILEILRTYNASMWLAGPSTGEGNYVDSLGATPLSGTGEAVGYVFDAMSTQLEENEVRNSKMEDAALGSTPPSSFIMGGITGVTTNIVEIGSIDGHRYVDLAVSGTAASTGDLTLIEPNSLGYMDILPNEVATSSVSLALMEGSWPARVTFIGLIERNAGGSFLTNSSVDFRTLVTDGQLVRVSCTRLVTNAAAAFVSMALRITAVQIGDVIDFTIRITQHQVNKGNSTIYFPTPVGSSAPRSKQYIPAYQATTGFKPILAGGMSNELINSRTLSSWSQTGPGTVTLNAAKALDGSMAATVVKRTGPATLFFSRSRARPGTAALSFSGAVVAKPGIDGRFITVRLQGVYPAYSDVMFDMHSGTVVYTKVNGGMTLTKYDIKALKDGYWLCRMVTADPGGVSAVLSFTTKETRSDLDTAASAGDKSDVIIDNTALGFSSDFFEYPFPVNAAVVQETNQAPYSWKFDGVDDRLSLAKPTVDPNGDHFFIVCFKMPPTPIGIATWVAGAGNAGVSERAGLVFLANNQLVAFWRDTGAVNNATLIMGPNRAVNEKIVGTARRSGANFHGSVRGDVLASDTQTMAVVMNAWTPTLQVIGAGISAGSVNFFSSSEIYGVISGNGNPTAGELLAMENFLAGHAGFTPLP